MEVPTMSFFFNWVPVMKECYMAKVLSEDGRLTNTIGTLAYVVT